MNSKEGQSALETMLMESLIQKLKNLGADISHTQHTIQTLEFNEIRAHLTRTDEDLKAQFPNLF
ncbi:MAG: phosphoribosyl-ATP pyrophosphatase [Alysiella sp.]|uniref:phosphoribosyl-ATP pyrophosphatase n=1 Tax=Alysiella sp. TaxID=1872483 RepID=UPI0026DBE7A3|nr:phosphoribosyl-ATP pyrophosphatase [Alysiella sp.]MDO4434024.1 phosphoribosyl-ATP pyrophosphatase [Alysiella sp.]